MPERNRLLRTRLLRLDAPITRTERELARIPGETVVPAEERPQREAPRDYSGFITVRLSPEVPIPSKESKTLSDASRELELRGLEKVLDEYGVSASARRIRSLSPEEILKLERTAMQSELPPLHSLTAYWRLDVRDRPELMDELLERLNSLPEVDRAYPELTVSEPAVNAADDPYNALQGYLDAAPTGIDARWAWTQPNGEGAGIGFVDLERGWNLSHEDFAGTSPTLIYGDIRSGSADHGTAVLGEVIADDNTVGVVGIAPSCSSVRVTSHYDAATDTSGYVDDAILAVIPSMNAGDVLLLEVQKGYKPTEIDDADFDAIRLAVARGIVVVEAAGNGDDDLDAYTDSAGDFVLNRASADFRESGAIMVGACESALPHDRWQYSNYGSRIDCFAWGENVTTAGDGDLDDGGGNANKEYTDTFSGTSSASPIVTGAAMILQGMYEANTGSRLSPTQMRVLLSDPATGTAQGGGVAGDIGVMPNLRAIIEDVLEVSPDVYLRDAVGDTGAVPHAGAISASPDIIVRPAKVADPNASFGQGSGTENSNTLGYEVLHTQNNYVYVRMQNRGGANAVGVTASVYWSEVATLVTPGMWHLIGTTVPIDVPTGDVLRVTDPMIWLQADIPATGHYCFVGILDHAADPAPPLPGPTDWSGFYDLIRNQNNVTWRNFNVVDPDESEDPAVLPFLIVGAPDRPRVFDFEILLRVSRQARVWLEVPLALGKVYMEGRHWEFKIDRKRRTIRLLLPTTPRIFVPEVNLGEAARYRAAFVVEGIRDNVELGNWIAIRQLYKRMEMGRITWQFDKHKEG